MHVPGRAGCGVRQVNFLYLIDRHPTNEERQLADQQQICLFQADAINPWISEDVEALISERECRWPALHFHGVVTENAFVAAIASRMNLKLGFFRSVYPGPGMKEVYDKFVVFEV